MIKVEYTQLHMETISDCWSRSLRYSKPFIFVPSQTSLSQTIGFGFDFDLSDLSRSFIKVESRKCSCDRARSWLFSIGIHNDSTLLSEKLFIGIGGRSITGR